MTVEGLTNPDGDPVFIANTMEWIRFVGIINEMQLPTLASVELFGGVIPYEKADAIIKELSQVEGVDPRLIKNFTALLKQAKKEKSPLALV